MNRVFTAVLLCILTSACAAQTPDCAGPEFAAGSGHYSVVGAPGREEKCIDVYYHLPRGVTEDSDVIMVVPGAGRNGWDYRDAWVEASEKYNVVVLSPSFSEDHYPRFWNYNLAGMITDVEISASPRRIAGYKISLDPTAWILSDLDRIFSDAAGVLGLNASQYDAFGHSAGGQLLHRMAIFHLAHKARRIISANSGWYTVPVFDDQFPYGLNESIATQESLAAAFKAPLVIYLGELDDENETRGDLASSPEIDVQGPGRVQRGKYFYAKAQQSAQAMGAAFEWEMAVVPGIGHDHRGMSKAAAKFLYESPPVVVATSQVNESNSTLFGLVGKLTAKAGHGRELAEILIAGSRGLPGNIQYLVSLDGQNSDQIWIYELWENEASHKASLQLDSVREAIAKGRPLIESFELSQPVVPVDGL